jgi:hypothetical protein
MGAEAIANRLDGGGLVLDRHQEEAYTAGWPALNGRAAATGAGTSGSASPGS